MRKIGARVLILIGDPNQSEDYIIRQNFFISKCDDSKEGLFYKKIYYPSKWILENDDFDYHFIVDSDSFVNPTRLINLLTENFNEFYSDSR